jgi:outer membrane receptor for ferric coprogen and ferric-rhodotorulic acid
VALNINNVLNKNYFSDIWGTSNVLLYTWGAPRSVNLSMRYDF